MRGGPRYMCRAHDCRRTVCARHMRRYCYQHCGYCHPGAAISRTVCTVCGVAHFNHHSGCTCSDCDDVPFAKSDRSPPSFPKGWYQRAIRDAKEALRAWRKFKDDTSYRIPRNPRRF